MNSVNTQQYAPYHANYEMSPKPTPIRHEDSAEAQASPGTPSDSAAPRQPMPTQQRGQFSTHRGLVNSPASATPANADRMKQLHMQNLQLHDQLKKLVERLDYSITGLRSQVKQLSQTINTNQAPANAGSPYMPDARSAPGSGASPAAGVTAENTPVPEQGAPVTLKQLTDENNLLRETINRLQEEFTKLVAALQNEIQMLNEKLNQRAAPSALAAAQGTGPVVDTGSNAPAVAQEADTPQVAAPAHSSDAAASEPRTLDDLQRENEQLRLNTQEIATQYEQTVSQLEQQIKQLNDRVKTLAG